MSGSIDKYFQFSQGTMANLIDIKRQYTASLPKTSTEIRVLDYHRMALQIKLKQNLIRKEKRMTEKNLKKIQEQIRKKANYIAETYNISLTNPILLLEYRAHQQNKNNPLGFVPVTRRIKEVFEELGEKFFTKKEVEHILREDGVLQVLTLIDPKNFVYD